MTPASIIQQATADGVTLSMTPAGAVRATGNVDAVNRWSAVLREHKPEIVAALRESANDEAARIWQVRYPGIDPMNVIFAPEATRAEVAAIYLGGRIERASEPPRRVAAPAEAKELRELVGIILTDATDVEFAEVFAVACNDPETALTSFRVLAADLAVRNATA